MKIQPATREEAIERFTSCAVCCGYCFNSGRIELAETFEQDLEQLFGLMGADQNESVQRLLRVMDQAADLWIEYYAAVILFKYGRQQDAARILERIVLEDRGRMVVPKAVLALDYARGVLRSN